MSNFVLQIPLPPNGAFALPITKSPRFSTMIENTASNRGQTRISLTPYAIWDIQFSTVYLKGSEGQVGSAYANFIGQFLQMKGAVDDFLLSFPGDSTIATPVLFGIGDGSTAAFQLTRSIAGGLDIIQNLNGNPNIYVNGILQSPAVYSISATGVVTFSGTPDLGATLTWSGGFYYRVHFVDDSMGSVGRGSSNSSLEYIGPSFYKLGSLQFESVIL